MKDSPQRIAIGIVENSAGRFLVTKRGTGKHLANYWEFPGGKVDPHESFKMALRREMHEEVGICPVQIQKILEFKHQYDDRLLHFQVFKIISYLSKISACEEQQLSWLDSGQLERSNMPAANRAIISALQLPRMYMIADFASIGSDEYLKTIERNLAAGIKLIQLRAHELSEAEYIVMAKKVYPLCQQYGAAMISNCNLKWINHFATHGVHLTTSRLIEIGEHVVSEQFFSASCHTQAEIEIANRLNIKCILVGPVHTTSSHTAAIGIQWDGFNRLCNIANMPVYALGGVKKSDDQHAIAHGAQGIAGISTFLSA